MSCCSVGFSASICTNGGAALRAGFVRSILTILLYVVLRSISALKQTNVVFSFVRSIFTTLYKTPALLPHTLTHKPLTLGIVTSTKYTLTLTQTLTLTLTLNPKP